VLRNEEERRYDWGMNRGLKFDCTGKMRLGEISRTVEQQQRLGIKWQSALSSFFHFTFILLLQPCPSATKHKPLHANHEKRAHAKEKKNEKDAMKRE
jgi:hypothetical protein